jgi:hypothetical protein
MTGAGMLEQAVQDGDFVFLADDAGIEIAFGLILLKQGFQGSIHISRWGVWPRRFDLPADFQERCLEQLVFGSVLAEDGSDGDAGVAGDVFEGDFGQASLGAEAMNGRIAYGPLVRLGGQGPGFLTVLPRPGFPQDRFHVYYYDIELYSCQL